MLKTSVGMTHGRGITDNTLTKWVHALPRCVPVCDALEKFTSVKTGTSEQHKDLRSSTQAKYNRDHGVFQKWLQIHQPFAGFQPDRLVSIATGVVADASVNCNDAVNISLAAAFKMDRKHFTEVTLQRSDKVKTMSDKQNSITVRGKATVVNPDMFFNRINCILKSSSDPKELMSYELAPHDGVMRRSNKSALGILLKSFVPAQPEMPEKCHYVLDGGHLLQSVVWPQQSNYRDVCHGYVSYTLKHFGALTTVVFDGYNTSSTKAAALYRQGKRKAFNLLHKKKEYGLLQTFNSIGSTHQQVQNAGESFLLKLHGASSKCASLDKFRYLAYKKAISRTSLGSTFQLSTLPPTSAAAKQHSFRTYLAVQEWMGNHMEPTEWG
ncbi:hypothetical protein Pcinc_009355 [Petrolisthes cinctipes]|uniref:Uncharacterized protein n=1 Tax=Petrolisthes cinctipes TaxID=88211 RepID=A0AAE1G5K5_PETCI|nr:hypothetical protein Pcinc_009355 [Petrolisthes cinctipes]